MLKSCSYCGKIHPKGYVCPSKPKKKYNKKYSYKDRDEESVKFRRKNKWKIKAEKIKERDQWCCLVCLAELYGDKKITYRNLEVHHIEKLRDNIDLGLENNNLITLCPTHHRMADKGEIPKSTLKQLIPKEKEENYVY